MMRLPLLFLTTFLIGSFPTAYVIGRAVKKIDIRQQGSGNVGATNVFRVLGKKYGLLVFTIDFLKGAAAVLLTFLIVQDPAAHKSMGLWIGLGAILGHVFTPFLGFKGGKGVATGAGVLFAAYPIIFTFTLLTWLLVFVLTKTVSISSIIAVFMIPILSYLMLLERETTVFFLVAALLFTWTHRSNIFRIIRGEEEKLIK